DAEFTEMLPMEDNIEGELAASNERDFRRLYSCLLVLSEEQLHVWLQLRENGVSVQSLVAVLSFFVLTGNAKAANVQQRVGSLHAASLYLLLLGIPGSIANKVFHEVLLNTCMSASTHCWPQDLGKKRKKGNLKSSQAEGKRSKPHRKETQEMEVDEEEEEEEELNFSSQDLNRIRDALVLLLQSLLRLLQTFSLKDKPQIACSCPLIFSKLLYFEPVIGELNFAAGQDINELRSIPEMAFYGLQLICSAKHGDQNESVRRVFQRLLYVILMMNKGDRGRPTLLVPGHAVLATRDQAIHFVCHIVNELKEVALPLLKVLLQHICFQIVEKFEFRNHGAQAVGMLTSEMPSTDYAHFIKWLSSFSRHSKMVSRLFSVDVVMVLLGQPERRPEECGDPGLACYLSHQFLIQNLLFARRNDHSPTVQSHVLACLGQCLELPSLNATYAVQNLFSARSLQQPQKTYHSLPFRTVEVGGTDKHCSFDTACTRLQVYCSQISTAGIMNWPLIFPYLICSVLIYLSRSLNSSSLSLLQALVGLLKHGVIPMSLTNLSLLSERCRDPAVSVKKKALQCVGEMLNAKPECCLVQKAWLQGVVPAVVDSESSVQEKALEALDHVLLRQIQAYSACHHLATSQRLTWKLLNLLSDECQNLRFFVLKKIENLLFYGPGYKAVTIWIKQNKFTVVAASVKIPYGKLMDAWDNMDVSVTTCCHIMCVIGEISAYLNEETKDRIVDDLMRWLKSFSMSLELISAAIDTLQQLGRSDDVKETQAFMNLHCGELVSISEDYLSGIILNENGTQNMNEELMVKHLHTVGVASLNCPGRVSKRTVLLVESIITPVAGDMLPASLPVSQFKANSLPTKVRAHGVITLGKLCLQREELVQKYLPVFARELELGTEVAVRNNIVVIMCDLCVRYTSRVDHYIPNISACLRDDEPVIREQTFIMLTNLLQEEFVKWKGSLFFCFMVVLVDPIPGIASLCEYCLVHILLKKSPEMFSQHFIECIYHFNSYSGHNSYNKFPQTEREKVRFSLKGPQHREKRFRIYRFLLQHFTDAQRFNITNKINQSVLACFANEELPLDADGEGILAETFNILTLKEMKLQVISHPPGTAAGEEQEEANMTTMAKAVLQAAQNKVVSQVRKKTFIENTVPLIISLKHLLEQKQSTVLKDLTAYLQATMQDYRHEVKEFFAGDEQLAAEVEFVLKEAEKERELENRMDNCSLNEDAKMLTAQVGMRRHPFGFSTPQPLHRNQLPARLAQSERYVYFIYSANFTFVVHVSLALSPRRGGKNARKKMMLLM
uniref:Non-SMC condensin II complex, subunit D3 n=1 Tax=Hippocampus comes TaxID=109280 RepID=A0A3Q2YUT4_HIPCM